MSEKHWFLVDDSDTPINLESLDFKQLPIDELNLPLGFESVRNLLVALIAKIEELNDLVEYKL